MGNWADFWRAAPFLGGGIALLMVVAAMIGRYLAARERTRRRAIEEGKAEGIKIVEEFANTAAFIAMMSEASEDERKAKNEAAANAALESTRQREQRLTQGFFIVVLFAIIFAVLAIVAILTPPSQSQQAEPNGKSSSSPEVVPAPTRSAQPVVAPTAALNECVEEVLTSNEYDPQTGLKIRATTRTRRSCRMEDPKLAANFALAGGGSEVVSVNTPDSIELPYDALIPNAKVPNGSVGVTTTLSWGKTDARREVKALTTDVRPEPIEPAPPPPGDGKLKPIAPVTLENGELQMYSIPQSNVVLDGTLLGVTPRFAIVSPGSHTVMFLHAQRGRKSVMVTVKAGETKSTTVRFTP